MAISRRNLSDICSLSALAYELLTGKLPYGRRFANRRDVSRLRYVPAVALDDSIPPWVGAALEKAVHREPSKRTAALSALVEDLRRPNPSYALGRPRPLLARNPVAFWRSSWRRANSC